MSRVELLISCMHRVNADVAKETNLHSDALIINQCDEKKEEEFFFGENYVRMISTDERGLSRSRNMAIANCRSEIALLCDDDEKLFDSYAETIEKAYDRYPEADLIAFKFANQPSALKQEVQKLNQWTCLRVASWQISFKVDSVRKKNLGFDVLMGAGSGNGAGEEVKFMRDCLKAGLTLYYVPEEIGTVDNGYYESGENEGSMWFEGFDEKFFYQRGMVNRYMLGLPVAVAYAFYYTIRKKSMYEKYITPSKALGCTLKGIIGNDITKMKRKEKK